MQKIIDNYAAVQAKIANALKRSANPERIVTCLCISKKQSVQAMQALLNANQSSSPIYFGENYVQECMAKQAILQGNYQLHLTGPLQSNKVKVATKLFNLIQTVDSVKLAQLIAKAAHELNKVIPIYIQVNISDDISKHGFQSADLLKALAALQEIENIKICGLMTITRFYTVAEAARLDFQALRKLRDQIQNEFSCSEILKLSMGMSQDYEIAIEEGADLVRVGTAIFGER